MEEVEVDGLNQVQGNVTAVDYLDTFLVIVHRKREKIQPEVRSKAYAHRLCIPPLPSPAPVC